jgi:hypothetical protein
VEELEGLNSTSFDEPTMADLVPAFQAADSINAAKEPTERPMLAKAEKALRRVGIAEPFVFWVSTHAYAAARAHLDKRAIARD